MSLTVHEFYQVLGDALKRLDDAKSAGELADAAQRRLNNLNHEISALADAHGKLKADSDAHLAANQAKMNEETAKHQAEIDALKKQYNALEDLHKTQRENASATITRLNTEIAVAQKHRDEMNIENERMKSNMHEFARKFL